MHSSFLLPSSISGLKVQAQPQLLPLLRLFPAVGCRSLIGVTHTNIFNFVGKFLSDFSLQIQAFIFASAIILHKSSVHQKSFVQLSVPDCCMDVTAS